MSVKRLQDEARNKRMINAGILVLPEFRELLLANVHLEDWMSAMGDSEKERL